MKSRRAAWPLTARVAQAVPQRGAVAGTAYPARRPITSSVIWSDENEGREKTFGPQTVLRRLFCPRRELCRPSHWCWRLADVAPAGRDGAAGTGGKQAQAPVRSRHRPLECATMIKNKNERNEDKIKGWRTARPDKGISAIHFSGAVKVRAETG